MSTLAEAERINRLKEHEANSPMPTFAEAERINRLNELAHRKLKLERELRMQERELHIQKQEINKLAQLQFHYDLETRTEERIRLKNIIADTQKSLMISKKDLNELNTELRIRLERNITEYKNLKNQGTGKINEAKLIIVGEPGAGKTTLLEKLFNPEYIVPQEQDSTLGIQVREGWQFDHPTEKERRFTANIWDFGGQQIQYMTHQFFLTPSAVYLLVSANDRKETTANFRYWFKIIHLLGEKKGTHSPILVVLNDKNGKFINQFDLAFYQKQYPELKISMCEVNLSKNDERFFFLSSSIQNMLVKLQHVNDDRPIHWDKIRKALRERAEKNDHICFSEYATICTSHGILDEGNQKALSGYLHEMGSILHFMDDPTLSDFIILNPQWAVDAVYSVLNDNTIAQANGYFSISKLESIWKNKYNMIEQGKLLNLMTKENFEICYKVDGKDNIYIAPQLLNESCPLYEWSGIDALKFSFQYKFMPEGIITRLIVRLNHLITKGKNGDLVWRKGMVLERNDCHAQIHEEENRDGLKVIDITITGKVSERKYLLRTIRDEIEMLHHKWFRNIDVEQMIPCNCHYCTNPDTTNPKYFEFSVLQRAQERGKTTVECDREFVDVQVSALLEGVFESEELKQIKHRLDTDSEGFPPSTPTIHIHNHPPAPTEKPTVQKEIPLVVHTPPTPERWHKQWWVFSVTLGMIAAGLAGFWLKSWPIAIGAGVIVGYLIYLLNTKRRFWRGAMVAFGWLAMNASPSLAVKLGWIDKTSDNNKWFLLESGEPLNIVVTLAVIGLIGWFAWLDHKQG